MDLRIVAVGVTWVVSFASAIHAAAPLDPANGTWHIGLDKLFGEDARGGKRLDIYPVFIDGRWVNALATARMFNTSVHLVEESDVRVTEDRQVVGRIKALITPDTWVPQDGQAFHIEAEIRGRLNDQLQLSGTYTARRTDGRPIHGEIKNVEANLIGAVGRTE